MLSRSTTSSVLHPLIHEQRKLQSRIDQLERRLTERENTITHLADELAAVRSTARVARSESSSPGGGLSWILLVSDRLVRDIEDWSEPVQFKFERCEDRHLEMWMRTV